MPQLSIFLYVLLLVLPTAAFALAAAAAATTTTSIVTGANGYVGRAIVHELLLEQQQQNNNKPGASEQSIICLVRTQRVAEETAYWKQVLSEQPREAAATVACSGLQVLPYDMLDGGTTLRAALDQCSSSSYNSSDGDDSVCLYHVASVFGPTENHQETALQNVQGTCDVLETVHCWRDDDSSDNNNKACKVILTSSMAAVRGSGQAPSNGKFYTAADWNTNSVLGANWGASYQWSKMESEQRARQLAENYNIPLVSMCPSFVFGPPYGGGESSSFSIQLVRQWTQGESPVQSRLLVDLRDVAAAHVRAGQSASLQTGRLILSTDARVPSRRLADWIRDATAPQYRDAIHSDDEFTGGAIPIGQKEVEAEGPLRDILGIELRTIQETMQDMTVRLVEQQQ